MVLGTKAQGFQDSRQGVYCRTSFLAAVCPSETGSHSVAHAGFKIVVLLLHLLSTCPAGLPLRPDKLGFPFEPLASPSPVREALVCRAAGISPGAVEARELSHRTTKAAGPEVIRDWLTKSHEGFGYNQLRSPWISGLENNPEGKKCY